MLFMCSQRSLNKLTKVINFNSCSLFIDIKTSYILFIGWEFRMEKCLAKFSEIARELTPRETFYYMYLPKKCK